jgi:hypothetical protein
MNADEKGNPPAEPAAEDQEKDLRMNTTMKKMVASVAVAGAMAAGTIGLASSAYAADDAGGAKPAATAANHPRLRRAVLHRAAKISADTLGVSVADLRTALKGGQSVNEYAEQTLGKDPQTVKDALVNAADNALDKAAANGRIDQARADELKGKVPARVDKLMDHHFGQGGTAS